MGRAVANAQAELDLDDDDVGSRSLVLGEFRVTNTRLAIDVHLPLQPDVLHAAANVLHALSRDATNGLVEVTCNGQLIDLFPFGPDDEADLLEQGDAPHRDFPHVFLRSGG